MIRTALLLTAAGLVMVVLALCVVVIAGALA